MPQKDSEYFYYNTGAGYPYNQIAQMNDEDVRLDVYVKVDGLLWNVFDFMYEVHLVGSTSFAEGWILASANAAGRLTDRIPIYVSQTNV